MWVRRRRRIRSSGLRFRWDGSFMSEAKTDRQFTGNDAVNTMLISSALDKLDIFNQNNVVIAEYNNGRRIYLEPCLNRMVNKVNIKLYKVRKRQMRAEGM